MRSILLFGHKGGLWVRGERGIETIEFIAFFPFFLMAAMIIGQIVVAGQVAIVAAEAAREGARVAATHGDYDDIYRAVQAAAAPHRIKNVDVPPLCPAGLPGQVTVELIVPFLNIPFVTFEDEVVTSATAMFRCEPTF